MAAIDEDEYAWSDEHLEALEAMLKPCCKHGNKATFEEEGGGTLIMAHPCACYLDTGYYDVPELAVEWWNEQPRIDDLQATITQQAARIASLEADNAEYSSELDDLGEKVVTIDWELRQAQALIIKLEAQLAAAGEWEPVGDGDYLLSKREGLQVRGDTMIALVAPMLTRYDDNGEPYQALGMRESVEVSTYGNYRLFRRKPQPQEPPTP